MEKDLNSYILTKQELLIMKVIWDRGSATVREVYDTLSQRESKAYTTILTFMQILGKKGVVSRRRKGHCHLYRPILSKRQAAVNQVNYILDNFFEGNPGMMIENVLKTELHRIEPKGLPRMNEKMTSGSAYL